MCVSRLGWEAFRVSPRLAMLQRSRKHAAEYLLQFKRLSPVSAIDDITKVSWESHVMQVVASGVYESSKVYSLM